MSTQIQRAQFAKVLRALACSGIEKKKYIFLKYPFFLFLHKGVILGPYIYTMAQPEQTLKYRFIRSTDENGELIKADTSYNRLATEVDKILSLFFFF